MRVACQLFPPFHRHDTHGSRIIEGTVPRLRWVLILSEVDTETDHLSRRFSTNHNIAHEP